MRGLTPAQLVSLSWVVCGALLCAATIARAAVQRAPLDPLVPSLVTGDEAAETPAANAEASGESDALADAASADEVRAAAVPVSGETSTDQGGNADPEPPADADGTNPLNAFAVLRFAAPREPMTAEDESLLEAIAQADAIEAAREEESTDESVVIAADRIEPASTQEQGGCRVRTNRALMARGVHRREPTGADGPFLADGFPVVAYFDTQNLTERHQRLIVQWIHEPSGAVERHGIVAGQSHRWRNWIEKPLPLSQIGPWRIELLDADRCLVDTLQFTLEAPDW